MDTISGIQDFAPVQAFTPSARYFASMDMMIYMSEDCAYRAERVDPYITLLWHPHEGRAVGVKFKGFKWVFNQLKDQLKLEDEHFVPICRMLETILTVLMSGSPAVKPKYQLAMTAGGSHLIDTTPVLTAAA